MPVVIDNDKCKGCGLCKPVCPYSAIEIVDKKVALSDDCTHCAACMNSCEFGAISFEGSQDRIRMDITPFDGIYVYVELNNDTISNVSLELLGKARILAGEYLELGKKQLVTAILIGDKLNDTLPDKLIKHGADHVIIVQNEHFNVYRTNVYARALAHIAKEKKPEILLFGATHQGRDIAPRLANRLQTGLTADCTSLEICAKEGILLQTRPAFGGNIMATIVCPDNRPQMATIRPGVMKIMTEDPNRTGTKEVMNIDLDENDFAVRIIDIVDAAARNVKLNNARVIVAGGRGVKSSKGFKALEELALELGAELGSSRGAVDAGWIEHTHQIGQTGKTVRPDLYIACGISGAVQHLAGMAESRYIISINKDESAPIASISDVTFVGDLLKIVPMLTKKVREHKEKRVA